MSVASPVEVDNRSNDVNFVIKDSKNESVNTTEEFHSIQTNNNQLTIENKCLTASKSTLSLLTNDLQLLTESFNKLSFDFYNKFMSKLPKNVIFAPFSISNLLIMCFFNADDKTKNDISKLLHFESSNNNNGQVENKIMQLKETFIVFLNLLKKLSNNLNKDESKKSSSMVNLVEESSQFSINSIINQDLLLTINNTVYCRSNYLLDNFKNCLKNVFNADIQPANISSENIETHVKKINLKSNKLTKKNIHEFLRHDHLNEEIFMLLVNTLHFEGRWKFEIKNNTEIGYFEASADKIVEVALLKIPDTKLMYCNKPKNLPCRICEIPFMNETFVFTIILPEVNSIDKIEDVLTYELFDELLNTLAPKRLNMVLPKFQIYDHFDYKDFFDNTKSLIDFQNVDNGLGINKSMYKSYFRLCEKGIEASSSTTFSLSHEEIEFKNLYNEHPCEDFTCDKPFLFFIREKTTRTILFMGKLLLPD